MMRLGSGTSSRARKARRVRVTASATSYSSAASRAVTFSGTSLLPPSPSSETKRASPTPPADPGTEDAAEPWVHPKCRENRLQLLVLPNDGQLALFTKSKTTS